jgi:L-lactate dehydrogenase complex protein LldG
MVAKPQWARERTTVSKEEIFARVRAALLGKKSAVPSEPETYTRSGSLGTEEQLQLLEERLREYDARVFRCSEEELGQQIADVLVNSGKSRMVHPLGVPAQWLDPRISWTPDSESKSGQLSFAEIEALDGVLTGATVAVAESGSIVLQHGVREGRRALTLLPDYHLCVLFGEQIVETLPECFDRLRPSATRPTTFISGPSATADIEMTRIKGVHGPRFLDVILVS